MFKLSVWCFTLIIEKTAYNIPGTVLISGDTVVKKKKIPYLLVEKTDRKLLKV